MPGARGGEGRAFLPVKMGFCTVEIETTKIYSSNISTITTTSTSLALRTDHGGTMPSHVNYAEPPTSTRHRHIFLS